MFINVYIVCIAVQNEIQILNLNIAWYFLKEIFRVKLTAAYFNLWFKFFLTCNISILDNVISDDWVTWKQISQKLIFWQHDREVRVLSCDLRGYLSFLWAIVAILRQSVLLVTSVFFFILLW